MARELRQAHEVTGIVAGIPSRDAPRLPLPGASIERDLGKRGGIVAQVDPRTALSMDAPMTTSRKAEHLRINLEEDVAAKGVTSGLEHYRLVPRALPEIDLEQVDTSTVILGHRLSAPLLISCMTGGVPEAERINLTLAEAAQELGIAVGLGSGRVLLEHPEALPSFNVRPHAPNVLLLANLGAVQLNRGVGVDQCRYLVELIQADALVLHLNALQEALQPEGDTCFAGLIDKIARLCSQLEVPVIAKEVGWGIAPDVVRQLVDAGVAAIDVAGAGGTSWSEVERHRMSDPIQRQVAAEFAGWGLPTAEAVRAARRIAPDATIFASGGIRTGMDVAKAIALGANLSGLASPFLKAANQGVEQAVNLGKQMRAVIRTAMFCIGAPTIDALMCTPRLIPAAGTSDSLSTGYNPGTTSGANIYNDRLQFTTDGDDPFLDITDDVGAVVKRSGIRDGFVQIFSSHTTAAIRINERETLLLADFRRLLDRIAPRDGHYEHDDLDRRVGIGPDEPRNGHAHCQHLMLSSSESVPLINGKLHLGSWQRIFLIELDSSRLRDVFLQVVGH